MEKENQQFHKKITYIYEQFCRKDLTKFTNFFYIEKSKSSFQNRQTHLYKNWIKLGKYSRMFKTEYSKYPFGQLHLHGQLLFKDADAFLKMDIDRFYQRIKDYIQQEVKSQIDVDTSYKYMYIFNDEGVNDNPNIGYYSIEYTLTTSTTNQIEITVTPPKNKASFMLEPYHGSIKHQSNKIILNFENRNDYISALFNTDLINSHSQYLVGLAIGIADRNEKIPLSKKVILTKALIPNVNELYPTLNETEILSAKENSYELHDPNQPIESIHLNKYIKKIHCLNKLFENLSKQHYFGSFYEQLAIKEFSAINNIFQKLKVHNPYYVNYRERVLNILLHSYKSEPYQQLYMVMPMYQEDNIFEHQSAKALLLQKDFIELSTRVNIEIIFVVEDCQQPFNYEVKAFLAKIESTVTIHFALKHQLETEVNSIDFLFTNNKNFIVTKFLRVDTPVFNIYQEKPTIEDHETMYRKIYNRSTPYEEFNQKGNQRCLPLSNSILESVVGEWHHYVYGSKTERDGNVKLWDDTVIIYEDGTVDYYSETTKTEKGVIINKEYQSVILLDNIVTKRLFTIVFDHFPHKIQKAFTVKTIAKQYQGDSDMFAIGIFSRKPIKRTQVQEILGDINQVRLLEEPNIGHRLVNYLIDEYGYYDN
jgi:hypothetical protein